MADDRQIERRLRLLDEWHAGVSVDRRFAESAVEEFRRLVTTELAFWTVELASRLRFPASLLRVDAQQ